jgi:protein-serine/threonine kinase
VEHGPAGGADAERIEIGLKREVEILKSIHHPCLVHLKAFGNDGHARALLVMNYCPGGDLFEVATKHREVLVPKLVRRIFSELVSATRYLHQKFIVHRDIKLESRCHKVRRSWSHADNSRRLAQHTCASSLRCRQLADARSSCCHSD